MNQRIPPKAALPEQQADHSILAEIRKLSLVDILFILALATKPLYLRKSGSIQISDLLFALTFGLLVLNGRPLYNSEREKRWISVFFTCLIYQVLINAITFFRIQNEYRAELSLFKNNLFYIFNFIVCLTVLQIKAYQGYAHVLKIYLIGTVLSVFVVVVGVLIQYDGSGRATGTFNNPNQLGYFCIVAMTAVTFFCKSMKPTIRTLMIVLCVVLSVFSLSKASIVSSAILLFAYFVNSRDRVGAKKMLSVLLAIVVVAALVYIIMFADIEFLNEQEIIVSLRRRLGAITTENDSALGSGRGYDRLKEIGAWIFVGVGEGANYRFTVMTNMEVHSLYASFLVSYGFVGFFLLMWLVCTALYTNPQYLRRTLCFSGVLLYCITHNGVRSTVLWAMIAMLLIEPIPKPMTRIEPETSGRLPLQALKLQIQKDENNGL